MEQDNQVQANAPGEPSDAGKKSSSKDPESTALVIHMWPKTPIMYPMAILALICAIVGALLGTSPQIHSLQELYAPPAEQETVSEEGDQTIPAAPVELTKEDLDKKINNLLLAYNIDRILGLLFLIVFAFSMFSLCIDLEIRWALIAFTCTLVVILALFLLNVKYEFIPNLLTRLASLSPMANPQFYFAIFALWVILMILTLGVIRFHYVKIESNEVIVVGGLLERQQRYPTLRMHYTKDISDVLEYYLPFVRSGRLILTFHDNQDTIVIDNVRNIDHVIKQLDKTTGVLKVDHK